MFKKSSNATYEITLVNKGVNTTIKCANRKEKEKWLYNYLTKDEKWWAYEEFNNSTYSSFDSWFKAFIQPPKIGSYQSIKIKTKTILIKKIL